MSDRPDTVSFPITLHHEHRLIFTRDVFAPANDALANLLVPREPGGTARAVVFWDAGLQSAFPDIADRITRWFAARPDRVSLEAPPVSLQGGEGVKNDFQHLERVWQVINESKLCRHSFVIAIGGGAVLDM